LAWIGIDKIAWPPAAGSVLPTSENLCRAELSPAETATHMARRKDIYIARHPETRATQGNSTARQLSEKSSFSQDTASKAGFTERAIQMSVRRSEKIASDVKERIKDTAIAGSTARGW